jgi:ABC-type branched-subunit amino acid transport system substrate-binding protein
MPGSLPASSLVLAAFGLLVGLSSQAAHAEKKYDPGASDTEIRIGNIMPYSGPASAFSMVGKTEAAYFQKINDEGGINGRKITFISYDDGFSPPKTVEQARKLVESDEVLLIFNSMGTATNSAIRKYMNLKKVPQLFVGSGATKWGDPKHFPWSMGWPPNYQTEARIYAKYILSNFPNGKIAMISGTDDAAKEWVSGFRAGLGDKADMIIAEKTFEVTDPTVESQIVALKTSGADILMGWLTPKSAAQTIRKVAELNWKPTFLLNNPSISVGAVLRPAGLENAKGIISTAYLKDPNDPQWVNDAGVKRWSAFMDKYYPDGDKATSSTVYGYSLAQTLVEVLKRCGDELTRENVMKQAASLENVSLDMLLPGITVTTGQSDFFPVEQFQLIQFNGVSWRVFGDVINSEIGH